MRRIYLDYAASTPVDTRVLRAMKPYFSGEFGNPGSLHSFGQKAIAAVDTSREKIGKCISAAHFREVIFTASATEGNNFALRGGVEFYKRNNPGTLPRVIISCIEHESILETARALEKEGAEIIYLPVDHNGMVDLEFLKNSLNAATAIVSIMYVNNEIGTVAPLAEIKEIIEDFKIRDRSTHFPLFHSDAAQAFQFFDCNVTTLGVDMMTLSGHKIYGPKGTGALYVRQGVFLQPQIMGGGQEFGMRSGTENVPGVVGFAKAVELAAAARPKESVRITTLREQLLKNIKKIFAKAEVNSSASAPHIVNVYFPGHAAQDLLTRFDRAGLAVSSGSACRSRATESSYVIEALGYSKERALSSIRFSLGRGTTASEIAVASKIVEAALRK